MQQNIGLYCFRQRKRKKAMSKKKKEGKGPMPAASAGLLRFFEEETEGVKIRPELLVIASVALIIVSVVAYIIK
jgi:preprotein translocase subunit Sec61beta